MRGSFSPEQLLALKVALGGRTWGTHALDLRFTLKWWRWQYYCVLLAGRNRRVLTDRERRVQRISMALVLAVFLLFSTAVGVLVLYLIKSALGIDLIPGFSFGVWGWFQQEFLL
ncbi:MAG: 3-phosphoshikimate 1-carboxyvinyltransferase [Burkholderiales bacterium PBB4]|nr:MAG: 3-phosphoshikimate 1-carboxyvinyltransferase [Burkholderiales bacterium PBB4]